MRAELHDQLEAILSQNEDVFEAHVQQWAHLLTDPSVRTSDGFQDLVFDPCSRSTHFTLLMELALNQTIKVEATGLNPDALLRASKIEEFKKIIETSITGRIAFESSSTPLQFATEDTTKLDAKKKEGTLKIFGRRRTQSVIPKEELLFTFFCGYGESVLPSQGVMSLSNSAMYFESHLSTFSLVVALAEIQELTIAPSLTSTSMVIRLSDGRRHHFSVTNILNPAPVFFIFRRLWWFVKGGYWDKLPQEVITRLPDAAEEKMVCGSLLYRSHARTQVHDMPALEGLYARFVNSVVPSDFSCEVGDAVAVPNHFFKSAIHSNVLFPFIVEITPDRVSFSFPSSFFLLLFSPYFLAARNPKMAPRRTTRSLRPLSPAPISPIRCCFPTGCWRPCRSRRVPRFVSGRFTSQREGSSSSPQYLTASTRSRLRDSSSRTWTSRPPITPFLLAPAFLFP